MKIEEEGSRFLGEKMKLKKGMKLTFRHVGE
jgi:hypothetical protein